MTNVNIADLYEEVIAKARAGVASWNTDHPKELLSFIERLRDHVELLMDREGIPHHVPMSKDVSYMEVIDASDEAVAKARAEVARWDTDHLVELLSSIKLLHVLVEVIEDESEDQGSTDSEGQTL